MSSAFAAGFFGRAADILAEKRVAKREEEKELRDAARRREERMETLMYQRYSSMLPYLMERQEKIKELEKQQLAARSKGIRLFGEKVTNTLENMGELQGVVAQYDSTENSAEWANTIVARTEGFLDKMLNSENEEERATAIKLMKKGSFFTNASAGDQTDFLSEFLATGTLSNFDMADMDLGSSGGTSYSGQVPALGETSVYTPVQLDRTAKELVASLIPGVEFQVVDGEYKLINPGTIGAKAVELAVAEVASKIEDRQYTLGGIDAKREVLKEYQADNGLDLLLDEIGAEKKPTVGAVPGSDTPIDPNSMELQETMQDVVAPVVTPPPAMEVAPNSWDPSAFDEDEEEQNGR